MQLFLARSERHGLLQGEVRAALVVGGVTRVLLGEGAVDGVLLGALSKLIAAIGLGALLEPPSACSPISCC